MRPIIAIKHEKNAKCNSNKQPLTKVALIIVFTALAILSSLLFSSSRCLALTLLCTIVVVRRCVRGSDTMYTSERKNHSQWTCTGETDISP
jgi:hypothetical protein